ncbi:winged helix-turn-helix transcriptional regulator [Chitinimonas naiadis]
MVVASCHICQYAPFCKCKQGDCLMSTPPFSCGLEAVVHLIGGKRKLLILFHLSSKRCRFSELRRLLGDVSEKVLSQQLKEMTRDGLVRRIDFQTVPPPCGVRTGKLRDRNGPSPTTGL